MSSPAGEMAVIVAALGVSIGGSGFARPRASRSGLAKRSPERMGRAYHGSTASRFEAPRRSSGGARKLARWTDAGCCHVDCACGAKRGAHDGAAKEAPT